MNYVLDRIHAPIKNEKEKSNTRRYYETVRFLL